MVKSNIVKGSRKRKFFEFMQKNKLRHQETLLSTFTLPNNTTTSPISGHLHLQELHNNPNHKKRRSRSRSPPANTACFSFTSSTCSSSSSPSLPCFLDSKSSPSPSFLNDKSPHIDCSAQLSLSSSPYVLRRTVSETPTSKRMRLFNNEMSSPASVPPDLMAQLPPLPPSPSPKLLRRTFSDPVSLWPDKNCSISQKDDEKEKMEDKAVRVEKLSRDLSLIKFKCRCGSYTRLLLINSETKCYSFD